MDIHTVFKFRDSVMFFDFEELSFVVDIMNVSLYKLGLSSALIAAELDGKNRFQDLMEKVKKHYHVSAADSEAAVMKFISMMQGQNLIEVVS